MFDTISHFFDPHLWLPSLGPLAIVVVTSMIFAESGLFFGFFLPGDSLLFTSGVLAAQGFFNIYALLACVFVAAVVGDNVGYWFGHKVGPKIFARNDSKLFKKKHLESAKKFYEKYGSKTILIARFVPFVRTFAPIVAGATQMRYTTFITYNLLGGFLWAIGLTLMGYFLGNIPFIREHNETIIILIILASIVPVILHTLQEKKQKREKAN